MLPEDVTDVLFRSLIMLQFVFRSQVVFLRLGPTLSAPVQLPRIALTPSTSIMSAPTVIKENVLLAW